MITPNSECFSPYHFEDIRFHKVRFYSLLGIFFKANTHTSGVHHVCLVLLNQKFKVNKMP